MSFSSSDDRNSKMVTLRSSDGIEFKVSERVAFMSNTIKKKKMTVEYRAAESTSTSTDMVIPLINIDANTLSILIEYCDLHSRGQDNIIDDQKSEMTMMKWCCDDEELKKLHLEIMKIEKAKRLDSEFDSAFLKNLDGAQLFSLGNAASHLMVLGLSRLVTQKICFEKIKDMATVEEMRQYLGHPHPHPHPQEDRIDQ